MKTATELTRTVLKSELIDDELMNQLTTGTKRFFVMDDLTNKQALFAERPPGTDFWWYSVTSGWSRIPQTDQYGVNGQFTRIGMSNNGKSIVNCPE